MHNFIEILLYSNTLNFIIVLLVIAIICKKTDVNKSIEKLQKNIKSYVDNSVSEKELAELELKNTETRINELPTELSEIKTNAENNVKNLENKLKREAENKKQDIKNNADRILNLEIKTFKEKLTGKLSQASIVLAENNAKEQLKNNTYLHNKYIEYAIDEINRINL